MNPGIHFFKPITTSLFLPRQASYLSSVVSPATVLIGLLSDCILHFRQKRTLCKCFIILGGVLLNTANDDKGPRIDVLNTAMYNKGLDNPNLTLI